MILGHYYLVVPKLTEEPLIYCLYIFWAVMFLKLMASLTVVFTTALPFLEEGTQLGDGYTFNWLFITMRYTWGYVAPLSLSLFTFRLCRLRSIQSATGVLYIVEFFVIVGELISVYLMAKHGLALWCPYKLPAQVVVPALKFIPITMLTKWNVKFVITRWM